MTTWRRLLAAALAISIIAAITVSSALGQEPLPDDATGEIHSWALSPAGSLDPEQGGNRGNLSYELDPGATVEDAVTVYNLGNVALTFRIYGTDGVNNAEGQFDLLPGEDNPTDIGSWITLAQDNVTVRPGQQVTMPITIEVPADASPGDHAGAILAANTAPGTGPDGQMVALERRTGTRVYIRVAGPLEPDLAIESVKTTYTPSLNPFDGTVKVTYRVRNRGNVRLAGSYSLSIAGPFGIARQRIPAEVLDELLPGEDVVLRASFDGVPATVLAVATVKLDPVDGADDLTSESRRALTLAPPITLVSLLLAAWFALRARRGYRRHRRDDALPKARVAVREPEPQRT